MEILKRLLLASALLAASVCSAFAAGTIPLSLTQRFDSLGRPLNGGLLYFYAAGTTTPQSAYQDSALTIPYPNPIVLDSAGNVPQLFFADGSIKVRLTSSAGVVQLAADGILVIGASSGGGGGSPVDPTTVLQTGAVMTFYGTGSKTGFVRCNGRTIGSAASGATERANADTQALYEYLWGEDTNLVVSGGRGASAHADWVANKTLALPDVRGRVLAGLDDMGNSAAGRLTVFSMISGGTTLGSVSSAAESRALLTTHLPPYTPSGSLSLSAGSLVGTYNGGTPIISGSGSGVGGGGAFGVTGGSGVTISGSPVGSFSGTAQGGVSTPFPIVQPTILLTMYCKL